MYSQIPNKLAQGRPIQVWVNRQNGQTNPTTVQLSSAITATATSIPVTNASNLASAGYIIINGEQIYYNNVENNVLNLCYRGLNGTTASAQASGSFITVYNPNNINIWATANVTGQYTFVYWRLRRIQDSTSGAPNEDIPFRALPAIISGLSYYLSMKVPEAMPRTAELKASYEEQFNMMGGEDREKASLRLVPRQMFW